MLSGTPRTFVIEDRMFDPCNDLMIDLDTECLTATRKEVVGDKSHSTRSKEESNKVQTDKKISDQKSKKISN
jgi:hypothetical protein